MEDLAVQRPVMSMRSLSGLPNIVSKEPLLKNTQSCEWEAEVSLERLV